MSQTNGNPIFTSRKESGYSPKLLNIDLSTGSIDTGYVKESVARKFLGGAGLAAKIVWEEKLLKHRSCPEKIHSFL